VIDKLLKKARQSLKTARLDLEAGDNDASVNRSYYAAFYAAWAMFEAAGVDKPKKHSGMISEFGRRFVKEGPLDPSLGATLARLENLRNFADYTLEETPAEKAKAALVSAEKFMDAIQTYVTPSPPSSARREGR
jgi:uncharacterized protein (UPF0332 family)